MFTKDVVVPQRGHGGSSDLQQMGVALYDSPWVMVLLLSLQIQDLLPGHWIPIFQLHSTLCRCRSFGDFLIGVLLVLFAKELLTLTFD